MLEFFVFFGKGLLLAMPLFMLSACPALAEKGAAARAGGAELTVTGPGHVTELWEGKVLTASFRAGMCFAPDGKARGVLLLRHANGLQDVYHLYGAIKNNCFELSHSSGHLFTGRLVGPEAMEGEVKLKGGMKLGLKGKRVMDAPLLAEDCAPLPQ